MDGTGGELPFSVSWSVHVVEADTGTVLVDDDGDAVLPCASIGKVLLLLEAARRFADGSLDPDEPLTRSREDLVGDSGIWQDLRTASLPAADVAALVGAVSDNLATNVLLRAVGLDAVTETAHALDITDVTLHDKVRDDRPRSVPRHDDDLAPGHDDLVAPWLATASARGLAQLFARLHRGDLVSRDVCATVSTWLAANTDLSMVASAWGLDPLAHRTGDEPPLMVVNKTGTDAAVRAEAGFVSLGDRTIAYAVIARWAADDRGWPTGPRPVLDRMRRIGEDILDRLRQPPRELAVLSGSDPTTRCAAAP